MKRSRIGITTGGVLAALVAGCCLNQGRPPASPQAAQSDFPELPEYVSAPLLLNFEKQARGLTPAQQKAIFDKYLAAPRIPTRVAVLDVVPEPNAPPIRFAHSKAVSDVIKSLLCQDVANSACRERVTADPVKGRFPGGVGRMRVTAPGAKPTALNDEDTASYLEFSELYGALAQIVGGYKPEVENLVIDIAVSVDPIKLTHDDPRLKPIVDLLKRASCMGALIIAPAGNLTGTIGPLIPAAFESIKAPAANECGGLRPARLRQQSSDGYTPLVYAVGALDAKDQRLVTTRPWGFPRLAAFGLSVTAPTVPGYHQPPFSPALGGTSMAAAVVGGVAGAVWSARPTLTAHQVMALVYEGGVPLDGGLVSKRARTEFCLGQPFGPCAEFPARRVFLCGALEKALPDERLGCVRTPSTTAEYARLPPDRVPPRDQRPPPPCDVSGCGVERGPMAVQLPNGAVPQPAISGCPGCKVSIPAGLASGRLTWYRLRPMSTVVVKTYNINFDQNNPEFQMSVWQSDQQFDRWVTIPSDTFAAVLVVTYYDDETGRMTDEYVPMDVQP